MGYAADTCSDRFITGSGSSPAPSAPFTASYDVDGVSCVRGDSRFANETTRFMRVVSYLARDLRLVG